MNSWAQEHILAPGKLLRRMLAADRLSSVIFYGPPGCGKTGLAHVIANQTKSRFVSMNAVAAGTKEVREVLAEARSQLEHDGRRTILFLDEIHRFNRSQQDVLLPDVEDGIIHPHRRDDAESVLRREHAAAESQSHFHARTADARPHHPHHANALADRDRGLGELPVTITDEALQFLAEICDGDARRALMALDIGVRSATAIEAPRRATRAFSSTCPSHKTAFNAK